MAHTTSLNYYMPFFTKVVLFNFRLIRFTRKNIQYAPRHCGVFKNIFAFQLAIAKKNNVSIKPNFFLSFTHIHLCRRGVCLSIKLLYTFSCFAYIMYIYIAYIFSSIGTATAHFIDIYIYILCVRCAYCLSHSAENKKPCKNLAIKKKLYTAKLNKK